MPNVEWSKGDAIENKTTEESSSISSDDADESDDEAEEGGNIEQKTQDENILDTISTLKTMR